MECERWCTYMYYIGRIDKLNGKMNILIANVHIIMPIVAILHTWYVVILASYPGLSYHGHPIRGPGSNCLCIRLINTAHYA